MKKYLTYLAGPYSHPNPDIQQQRFEKLTHAAGWLMEQFGWNVFSPITHSHPLHQCANVPGDWAFWKKIDTEYLHMSRRVVVLTLDGWEKSVGVTAELKIAKRLSIPVLFLSIQNGEYKLQRA